MTPGNERAFGVLASRTRIQILNALATGEKSIGQIARELTLHRLTLRYHLAFLLSQGLVEEVRPSRPHGVGRPAVLYRTSKRVVVPSFPPRHFEIVGRLALQALVESIGPEEARSRLEAKGSDVGRTLIRELAARSKVKRWTPDAFTRLVLKGLFRDYGIISEVLSKSRSGLTYRAFSCPFLEMAEEMPGLVCDGLDVGFHRGIDAAQGGVRTVRTACMGHGDLHCQYRMDWRRARGGDRRRGDRTNEVRTMSMEVGKRT